MVAPLILAGIGFAVGAIGKAILGKNELFAVVWIRHRRRQPHEHPGMHATRTLRPDQLHPGGHPIHPEDHDEMMSEIVGRTYGSLAEAETFQNDLSVNHHKSSIIVHQATDGTLDCQNPIKAVPARKRLRVTRFIPGHAGRHALHPGMMVRGIGDTPANPSATSVSANANQTAYHSFMDKRQVAMDNLDISTDHPVPHWAVRSRFGPYFKGEEDHWADTPSSHMWDVDVQTRDLPYKYGMTAFRGENAISVDKG